MNYTTLKVGYTVGIYGCSGEYFVTIYTDKKGNMHGLHYYGMYGVEQRVGNAIEEKGYKYNYIANDFGKMSARKVWRGFVDETEVLEQIKKI